MLKSIDRLIRTAQRRAALLGIDSPTKIEATETVRYEIASVDLAKLS